jgi:manganese oxidase
VRDEAALPINIKKADQCPGGVPLPCPEAVSAADPGTMVVNYRNEPVALRAQDPSTNQQVAGDAGDLSNIYRSDVTRANAALNSQPNFYPALTGGLQGGDPFTPLMRAYEADRVQIRVLVGAHEESHNFNVHGQKWLYERTDPNSGYRNSQAMGISEHFEFELPGIAAIKGGVPFVDYLYQPGGSVDNQWNGTWGLLRAYRGTEGLQPDLQLLPNNPTGSQKAAVNKKDFNGTCPAAAPSRKFSVTAVAAQNALPGGTLVYNDRTNQGGKLHDPTAILYVRTNDIDAATGKLKAGVPIEPLVLRANAGDCIEVTLFNQLPTNVPDLPGWNTLPMIIENFNANQVKPSNQVGLHPQLVAYDVVSSDGANVGFNVVGNPESYTPDGRQTAKPGESVKYKWYAGDIRMNGTTKVATPIEFGATNLISSDPIKHSNKGAIGSLIIEPQGATWIEDTNSRAQATVSKTDGTSFREFVLQFQTDINMRRGDLQGDAAAVPNVAGEEDAEDSGQKALNYRTEPMWKRLGYEPDLPLEQTRAFDYTNSLSNAQVGGDPVTPVFTARAGTPVRFRVLNSNGHARNNVFQVHGHIWQQEPYINNSTQIGNNPLSEWKGAQQGHGASNHMDAVPQNGAGGARGVTGDYLFRTQSSFQFDNGLWGIFRATP